MRCARCRYVLMYDGTCPVCGGKQINAMEPIHAIVPRAMRAWFVVPGHFESLRHYHAWCAGIPMHGARGRWKVPAKTRELIYRQFNRRCQWPGGCGTQEAPTVEHIVPVAFGGSNHPGNLTLLCPTHQRASWARYQQLLTATSELASA